MITLNANLGGDKFDLDVRGAKLRLTREEISEIVNLGRYMLRAADEDKNIQNTMQKIVKGYQI